MKPTLSNTLNSLTKIASNQLGLIDEIHNQLDTENANLKATYAEIEQRFAPKHLLGQILVIAEQEVGVMCKQVDSEYKNQSKSQFEQGVFPRHWKYTKNCARNTYGKNAKVESIELIKLENGYLVWLVTAIVQNNTGEYGTRKVSTYLFDKVEITD